jgi:hypothetical protein
LLGTLLSVGVPVSAVELTVEGTQVANPKVRGFERLDFSSASAGPILVQASTSSVFAPNVQAIGSPLGGSPTLTDAGFGFLGTVSESGGTVYQYLFNKFVFCDAAGGGPWTVKFVNTVSGTLQSSAEFLIAC